MSGIDKLKEEPYNNISEQGLLGIILLNEDYYYDIRAKSDWFYNIHNRNIFDAIHNIKSIGKKIDIGLLESNLEGTSIDVLYEIYGSLYSPSNLSLYEEDIYSCYVRRSLIKGLKTVMLSCYDSEHITDILSKLSKATDFGALSKNTTIQDCIIEIAMSIGEERNFISTYGYRDLDKALGGYMEGQLVIVGARPGVGKTLYACNMIDNIIKQGINACFITLEMTATEIAKRILSKRTGVSMRALDSDKSKRDLVQTEAAKVLETGYNFEIIDGIFDYHSICIEIKRQVIKNNVKVVYIDYLGLIDYADGSKTDNTLYSISQITKGLKRLAKEMKIAIVLLSQLNRDGANGKPHKAQLRSSGSIEQDADVIVLLYQDHEKEEHRNYLECIIDKNRNGIETSVYLGVSKKIMLIYDVDQEECVHL